MPSQDYETRTGVQCLGVYDPTPATFIKTRSNHSIMALRAILTTLSLQCLLASAQRVLKADLWRPTHTAATHLTQRQDSLTALLTQKPDKSMYWINITIGTPRQPQSLQLDTGSRSLWVPASGSPICSSLVNCAQLGSFDKEASSTYDPTGQSNTISYGDGSSVTGTWFNDVVRIGGETITGQLVTLATQGTSIHNGVLGAGWPKDYPTVNHNLAAQGLIGSNMFSLWLNDVDATTGTILFGGIDRAKFVSPLVRVPVVGLDRPAVTLTRVAVLGGGGESDVVSPAGYSETVILDTGTSLTVLPNDIATKIVNAVGAQFYPSGATFGNTIIPCNQKSKNLSLNFHFGGSNGPTITVSISQLVLRYLAPLNGVDMCQFGIYGSDGSYPITLGDSFLRSAYVVYDVARNQIGLAQSIVNAGGGSEDIVELP